MAVTTSIVGKIDNNYVKVNVQESKVPQRNFKVPQKNANLFCQDYKDNYKKNQWTTYGILAGIVLSACGITSLFTKNLSKMKKMLIGTIAGVIAATGAIYTSSNIILKREDALLKKHKAEEIIEKKAKFPI